MKQGSVGVVGAAAVDVSSKLAPTHGLATGSTSPGQIRASLGGVALNITRAAHKLGVTDVVLVSRVGTDAAFGNFLTDEIHALGLRTDGLLVDREARTGVVNMVFDSSGDLVGGVAELEAVEQMDAKLLSQMIREKRPELVCFDANLSAKTINEILLTCHGNQKSPIITAFEPTSVSKSTRVLDGLANLFTQSNGRQRLSIMFPNLAELEAINKGVRDDQRRSEFESLEWIQSLNRLGIDEHFRDAVSRLMPGWATQKGAVQMALGLMPAVETVVVKHGAAGVIVVGRIEGGGLGWVASRGGVMVKHFEAAKVAEHICNVTGAGDALCAAVVAAVVDGCKINQSADWDRMIDLGQRAARETLRTEESVGEI